jgi:serine/tyrosine/threonine adenylyltransferase
MVDNFTAAALPTFNTALEALDPAFCTPCAPTPLADLQVAHVQPALAETLGLPADWLHGDAFRRILAGIAPLPGAEPQASVYAGHQFGQFVPQLGDGRAHLIGRHCAPDHQVWSWQLKGSGPTPYSRHADGRAVLRSSLREYVASEALHALGIPTTRALAFGMSQQPVRREQVERAAIVLRIAPSFLRFGHFEFWASRGHPERVKQLADAVIAQHFPAMVGRYAEWLTEVVRRSAQLMAQWQTVGFCHGVMNSDNFSILGLTIDYGPYGFLDAFDPQHICNHSDHSGRYAWDQQPQIGQWNCARLLEACLSLLSDDDAKAIEQANAILAHYAPAYTDTVSGRWRAKFGLATQQADDDVLMQDFLQLIAKGRHDFTLCFRHLPRRALLTDLVLDQAALNDWLARYDTRLARESLTQATRTAAMDAVNPLYIARNHLLELAIRAAEQDDFTVLDRLMQALSQPFTAQSAMDDLAALPPQWAAGLSVSCSS